MHYLIIKNIFNIVTSINWRRKPFNVLTFARKRKTFESANLILLSPPSFFVLQSVLVQDSGLHVIQKLLQLVVCRGRTVLQSSKQCFGSIIQNTNCFLNSILNKRKWFRLVIVSWVSKRFTFNLKQLLGSKG